MQTICYNMYKLGVQMDVGGGGQKQKRAENCLSEAAPREKARRVQFRIDLDRYLNQ